MPFRVAQKTLERLEWPQVVARLHEHCRTPQARRNLSGGEESERDAASAFEDDLTGVLERLKETSEARALFDAEEIPPLAGVSDLEEAFRRSDKGGVLSPQQLLDLRRALEALHATTRFLRQRADRVEKLASLADCVEEQRGLELDIETCIDSGGEVLDTASPALREARSDTQKLASELQTRLGRYLQDPNVANALSDAFYTVRNDRYVLPVRTDSKARIPGIVHDASNSGTTLFIEPQAVVKLNNRLKQAELAVVRETEKVLRDLSSQVADALPALRAGFDVLVRIDLAFARGHLSREMQAVEPRVDPGGAFFLPQLRHPLIPPDQSVPNDVRLGDTFSVMVISGPNGGGKTVIMKAVALAALFVRAGLHVPTAVGAQVDLVDEILADIGDDQDIRESLSTFSAHMANVARIVAGASSRSLVVLDEVGAGTDPGEGASLAQAVLENLADVGAHVIATTHYSLLKEMAAVDSRFCNASVEFDPQTLAPTYRLHLGAAGVSSAAAVAARMGMPSAVLERANALLDREDRRLDRMLSELGASRATLETEQREVGRLRAESEAARDEYRNKLERLQERRDKLFHVMRQDLDAAFKDAHSQVAGVIRDLQRGATAQEAAQVRARLLSLEERSRDAEKRAGLAARSSAGEEVAPPPDWRHLKPGDRVAIQGKGEGVLEALPDRRGRVRLRVGSAVLIVPAEGIRDLRKAASPDPGRGPHKAQARALSAVDVSGGTLRCDLRGQRVEDALDQVADALDRAAREQRDAVFFVHGFGTGALRKAIREHLARSPYVGTFQAGDLEQGGDGVTIAKLAR